MSPGRGPMCPGLLAFQGAEGRFEPRWTGLGRVVPKIGGKVAVFCCDSKTLADVSQTQRPPRPLVVLLRPVGGARTEKAWPIPGPVGAGNGQKWAKYNSQKPWSAYFCSWLGCSGLQAVHRFPETFSHLSGLAGLASCLIRGSFLLRASSYF